ISLMREIAIVRAMGRPLKADEDLSAVARKVATMPIAEAELIRKYLEGACSAQARLTQFRYPKVNDAMMNDLAQGAGQSSESKPMESFGRITVGPGDIGSGRDQEVIDIATPEGVARLKDWTGER